MIYYLQEMLKITGVIAQSILVVLMILSFYAFFQVNLYYRIGPFLKWVNIMLLVVTIYGLILFFSGVALYPEEYNLMTSSHFGYLQNIFTSILPLYAFYYFTLEGDLSENNLIFVFFVFLIFSILIYYQNYFLVSEEIEKEEITNNMGYRFVPLIPMLSLIKMKDVWKYILLIIVFAFIMTAMKRGAILVGAVALILYIKHHLNARSTKYVLYIMLLSAGAICLIYLVIMNLYETSDYFKARIYSTLQGDTSNRGWMYIQYLDYFIYQTSSSEFFFGCGANATLLRFGNFAHNDWLEFAINQGLLGIMLCLFYWITFVWEWLHYKGNITYKQALGVLIVVFFLKSLFSMSFNGMSIAATLCIGYCLAQNEKAKRSQLINELSNRVLI